MARLTLAAVLTCSLLLHTDATAEPTLYLLVSRTYCQVGFPCPPPPARIVEVDLTTARIVREIPFPAASVGVGNLSFTADGQYLFWVDQPSIFTSARGLRVLDVSTGTTSLLRPWYYEPNLFTHPTIVKAFSKGFQNDVVVLEPGVERSHVLPNCTQGSYLGISGDGSRLLVDCSFPVVQTLVADSETGAVVGVLPRLFAFEILNETGDEVFTVGPTVIPSTGTTTLRRVDVATGAELAQFTYVGNHRQVFLDRRTGRLFVTNQDEVLAFDPVTLALLGRIALPTGAWTSALVFEPNRPRAYLLHQPVQPPQPFQDHSYLSVFDTERLVPLAVVRIPYAQATWSLAVAPEPPAPVNLSAIVAASQVTLTWQSGPRSPAITHFEIEAGSEPGAANLARLRSDDASFTLVVADVPPGRYYVRVRAYNYGGTSEPSNEILVTVP